MPRKRFNRAAICSTENYEVTHKAHKEFLIEKHKSFSGLYFSGEISIIAKKNPKYKVIKVFGKDMKITIEEYEKHCAPHGIKGV